MQLLLRIDESSALDPGSTGSENWNYLVRSGQSLITGRDESLCDIVISRDLLLSAAHFRVSSGPKGFELIDLKSRHGTLINGLRVTRQILRHGDQIVAGATRFDVVLQDIAVPAVPAAAAQSNPSDPVDTAEEPNSVAPRDHMRLMLQMFEERSSPGHTSFLDSVFTTILPGEVVVIGRVPERSDIAFPNDFEMSGAHAELSCDRHECRLRDLKSTNGTYLNGELMYNLLLRNGDELRVGRTQFIVHMKSRESAAVRRPTQTITDPGFRPGARKHAEVRSGSFRIVNTSPFPMAPLTGRIRYPRHSLTFIVRGTFQLRPNERAVLLEEQVYPTGDVLFPGDDDPSAPPRYESDFAFFKPRADILVVGHCCSPDSQPVKRMKAGIRVGALTKTLSVTGKRCWQKERGIWRASEPEPFTRLELTYRHAYGGRMCDLNPVGIGSPDSKSRPTEIPLPQIESLDEPMRSPEDVVESAGFGPLGRWYGRRRTELGTFDNEWAVSRWPWFPSDFSPGHYNAAPASQQVAGYLSGDEEIVLENLHPVHKEYRTALPGLRIRCFVNPLGSEFREVQTHLDTMWVDADAEQLVLVWRGNTDVASEDCRDIRHLFVLAQSLDEEPLSVNECHARLLRELWRHDSIYNPSPEAPPDETAEDLQGKPCEGSSPVGTEPNPEVSLQKFEAELEQLKAEIRNSQIAAGANPEQFDQQVAAETARLIREWGLDGEAPPADFQSRVEAEFLKLQQQVHATQVAAGLNPDPLPETASSAAAAAAGELSDWTRERIIRHFAEGESFAGEVLSGIDLSDLDLSGADFRAAICQGTKFARSRLCGAKFDLANLAGTDLTDAVLDRASLEQADLTKAILHNTTLADISARGAIFALVWLTGAKMPRADATGAYFSGADLTGAIMHSGRYDNANFAEARLSQADLTGSSLADAFMESVSARNAILDHCDLTRLRASGADLTESRFVQVRAKDSIWEHACLKSADFSYASLQGANLTQADLECAELSGADMSGARLIKANLQRSVLSDVKLFEASLQDANLANCNLSRSNLYGAEVSGAVWDGACLESANIRMTNLVMQRDS